MGRVSALAVAVLGWLGSPDWRAQVQAHAIGENYVFLNVQTNRLLGRLEFSYEDLEEKLGIQFERENPDKNREIAAANAEKLKTYVLEHFSLEADGQALTLEFGQTSILGDPLAPMPIPSASEAGDEPGESGDGETSENTGAEQAGDPDPATDPLDAGALSDPDEVGGWVQYQFQCLWDSIPDVLTCEQDMLQEGDRFHRTLMVLSGNAKTGETYSEEHIVRVFGRSNPRQDLDLRESIPLILGPNDFVWQGVLHIWIGIDHVLFLAVLLLPAVLRREAGQWVPVERFTQGLWNVIKIVTVFTLAHSITLALAALDLVRVPSAFVESVIAASIVLVALNNIWPKFHSGSLWIILGFGLFHGLGFASVMGELPFRMMHLKRVILAFNIGVELGQLAIVAVVFTLLFALRRWALYRPAVLVVGSVVSAAVAAYWFVERAFGL